MNLAYVCAQIIFESLPISSSTHTALLGLTTSLAVDFVAHGPTVLVLAAYFWRDIVWWFRSWRSYKMTLIAWLEASVVAECITAVLYLIFHWWHPHFPLTVGITISAFLLLSLWFVPHGQRSIPRLSDGVLLGLVQGMVIALPGVSRMAATYTAARWAGMAASHAFRFSCLLQVPLFAASALLGLFFLTPTEAASLFSWGSIASIWFSMLIALFFLAIVERLALQGGWWLFGIYLLGLETILFFVR
ncbi:MAG: undecaprenyl-diphosphate phosphatase [Candidatus Babeliaceae bacterium]|nr:undecaprenyl-diphosphate phosphatase [Candidatus Babeliaceae bacterium]